MTRVLKSVPVILLAISAFAQSGGSAEPPIRLGGAGRSRRRCQRAGSNRPATRCRYRSCSAWRQPTLSPRCQPWVPRIGEIPRQRCRRLRAPGLRGNRRSNPRIGQARLPHCRFCCPPGLRSPAAVACENSRFAPADSHRRRRFISQCDRPSLRGAEDSRNGNSRTRTRRES